jgi:aminomethyltransferase
MDAARRAVASFPGPDCRGNALSQRTILDNEHARLGARMVDFHGWDLPVQFEGILAEHRHCRQNACIFDTSHMGQLLIRAQAEDVGRVTTQNAAALPVGRDKYGFLLNEAGGILDDTILMRLGEAEFLLVVNAGPADSDLAWLHERLPRAADIVDQRAAGWGKLDLQGPASAHVLAPLTDAPLATLGYFAVTRAKVCGRDCILSRTGYTGELGYELFAPGESVVALFRELVAHPLVKPAGLGARDSLRLEAGLPLYGDDLDATTNPLEAGLEAFVSFDHDFLGADALKSLAARPLARKLVAFAAQSRQRAWHGNELWRDDEPVGVVTSAAFAPTLGISIGLGYVRPALAATGTDLVAKTPRGGLPVTVAEKPLYKNGTARTRLPAPDLPPQTEWP